MSGRLIPTKWYYPSASSGPVPCEWSGYVYLSPSLGEVFLTVSLIGC
jgi:hypothetical protein